MRSAAGLSARSLSKCRDSQPLGRRAVQPAKGLDGVGALFAERGHGVAGQLDLPRAEDLGVAGQDLLDERGAGSRQPHDEDRQLAFQPEAADPREELRRADCDHPGDEQTRTLSGRIPGRSLRHSDSCSALPRSRCSAASAYSPRASRTWARPKCNNNRSASVKSAVLQQAALRSQILLRKFAAQEFRQVVMRGGEAGIVPQGGAEAVFRALKIAHLLQSVAQVVVGLGMVRLQFQCPAIAGDRFVQLPLFFQARCPGCCAPRHSPASVPVPGGSRRPLRPVSPGPSRQCPGCVRLGVVRLQFQCPAVAGDRFVQFPLVLQGIAQVVVGLGEVRLQFQCPAAAGDRFVQLPLVLQGIAQVVVGLGKVRLQFQCPAAAGDRFVQLPLVPERMPRLLWASA